MGRALMRPATDPAEFEIIGVGFLGKPARMRGEHTVGNSILLRVCDRLFLGLEEKFDLRKHVVGTGPAHQRLVLARRCGLIVQEPLFRFRQA